MKSIETLQKVVCGNYYRHFDILARYIIAVVFVIAAVPKLFNVSKFALIIEAYGILPDVLLLPMAILLPTFELILAVGLIRGNRVSCICSIGLVLFFYSNSFLCDRDRAGCRLWLFWT
ncbi:MAG: hypothetical protein GY702_03135 [Desulfobulbaceae bacterium]|nr:hypothetical protein [Desulfobulbaceae bacterium]